MNTSDALARVESVSQSAVDYRHDPQAADAFGACCLTGPQHGERTCRHWHEFERCMLLACLLVRGKVAAEHFGRRVVILKKDLDRYLRRAR